MIDIDNKTENVQTLTNYLYVEYVQLLKSITNIFVFAEKSFLDRYLARVDFKSVCSV